ncbi:MAG TPA: Ca2+-dependent phosphoinositide-specific phospholipase C [Pirellulales bacterium]|jgi:hypothetical protein|nr:Ca2+-dependent phosphoinositide-specific phospholipase C [Pirellulales bacterium]
MKVALASAASLCLLLAAAWLTAAEPAALEDLRINQLQFIGTHNSYHVRAATASKEGVREWKYSHAPLEVQLDRGVRSLELDLHYRNGDFEVFHVPLLDEGTTCRRLTDALATVRRWSDAHPRHVPISILFELKKEGPRLDARIREVDAAGLEKLDGLLRAAFPPERRIAPDDVRSGAAMLRQAVESGGWPTLAASRGKVLFILHDDEKQRDLYTRDHPSLAGRVMFVRSDDQRDDGATLVLDDPRSPDIKRLVEAGYFIRTRADAGLRAETRGGRLRRDLALDSGAQIVSTDFPTGEAQQETGYTVALPEAAPARVNPVNGPEALRGQAVAE